MTTASKITMVRVVLIPFFIVFLILSGNGGVNADTYRWVALGIFVVASLSDLTACLMVFVGQGRMASWIAFIVVAREFAIMGLRSIAAAHGRVIAAGWSGKIKTSCTMVGLIAMMIFPSVQILDTVVCAVILVTTLYSGFEYFQKNWDVLMPGA